MRGQKIMENLRLRFQHGVTVGMCYLAVIVQKKYSAGFFWLRKWKKGIRMKSMSHDVQCFLFAECLANVLQWIPHTHSAPLVENAIEASEIKRNEIEWISSFHWSVDKCRSNELDPFMFVRLYVCGCCFLLSSLFHSNIFLLLSHFSHLLCIISVHTNKLNQWNQI